MKSKSAKLSNNHIFYDENNHLATRFTTTKAVSSFQPTQHGAGHRLFRLSLHTDKLEKTFELDLQVVRDLSVSSLAVAYQGKYLGADNL